MNGINVKCEVCSKEFYINPSRMKNKIHCCSKKCLGEINKGKPNCTCGTCGKSFHLKPSRIIDPPGINFCSRECKSKVDKIRMTGIGNHQFGLKGKLNPTYKNDFIISKYGYKQIRCENHPFKTKKGWVLEHRLIAEKYLLNDENSIEINGNKYLSNNFIVHHIDMDRLNNDVNNLYVLRIGVHQRFHNSLYKLETDELGRILNKIPLYDFKNKEILRNLFFEFIKKENIK